MTSDQSTKTALPRDEVECQLQREYEEIVSILSAQHMAVDECLGSIEIDKRSLHARRVVRNLRVIADGFDAILQDAQDAGGHKRRRLEKYSRVSLDDIHRQLTRCVAIARRAEDKFIPEVKGDPRKHLRRLRNIRALGYGVENDLHELGFGGE